MGGSVFGANGMAVCGCRPVGRPEVADGGIGHLWGVVPVPRMANATYTVW